MIVLTLQCILATVLGLDSQQVLDIHEVKKLDKCTIEVILSSKMFPGDKLVCFVPSR